MVPNVGRDWIVRPIQLAGRQELVLEPGVVIAAKRGEYRGGGDTVFSAASVESRGEEFWEGLMSMALT